jgi:CDP-glycerol glycerophosphotransferase (TagB/SpsB family)
LLLLIKKAKRYQSLALKRLPQKKKITVIFLVIHDSIWKYDEVYRLMQEHPLFRPLIVVCPFVKSDKKSMFYDMQLAFMNFKARGYQVIKSYSQRDDKWLNVKEALRPDIVCFTNPYRLTRPEYCITNWLDTLTVYIPYFFVTNSLIEANYNNLVSNLAWRLFLETNAHAGYAKKNALNKGLNVRVTGYPALDIYFDKTYCPTDPWKLKNPSVKRIIWAPHHTIDGQGANLNYSNFLVYHQTMIELARRYSKRVQFVFKPHPLLKGKLYKHPEWGKWKTDNYYKQWEKNIPNGQICTSEYTDLFLTSDALIHDCASFMVEYLCTEKPYLYLLRDPKVAERMNKFGKKVFELHYHANNKKEICEFIEKIVLENNDHMMKTRKQFIKENLIPPNNASASRNIFEEILKYTKVK